MKKALIIYEEERILTADFYHPKSDDYLAPAILDLYSKVQRWFKKYGYVLK